MQKIDREGNFLAKVRDHGVRPYDSGSVMFGADFDITHVWNAETQEWEDWTQYEYTAFGMFTIRKTDGTIMEKNVQALARAFEWYSGDLMELQTTDYSDHIVQISVKPEVDKTGATVFKAKYVSHREDQPFAGGVKKGSVSELASLNSELGSQLRALMPSAPATSTALF